MFQGASLHKISIVLLTVLLAIASLFSLGTLFLTKQTSDINTSWLEFRSQQSVKARLETSLLATLGYGGMIHDFKNYILRKDFERLNRLQRSLGAAQAIVTQYHALSSTQAEKMALDDIQEMLQNYQGALVLVRKDIRKGRSSREIDRRVRINDKLALRGLRILSIEISAEYPYHEDHKQKSVLATSIRSHFGYGEMIHSFKNYVLRHDKVYHEQTLKSILKVEQLIKDYRKLNPNLVELTALEDIVSILRKYKENLSILELRIEKGQTPEQIDAFVKINDRYALRGLTALDHDIALQIETESRLLSEKMVNVINIEYFYMFTAIFLFLILAFVLYWVFTRKIIYPVQKIAGIMSTLAEGELDVDIEYPYRNTELGAMFLALSVFKQNEIKRRKGEEEIRRMAMTDPLTGLANRNQLEIRYKDMAALARREKRLFAVLLLDLDKFKPVNDGFGHGTGDALLKKTAEILVSEFRESDLVVRLGGDEFVVLLYGPATAESVTASAMRVVNVLSAPLSVDGHTISIGVSIGIVFYSEKEETLELILRHADIALYAAKESGRNTYRFYEPEDVQDVPIKLVGKPDASG